MPAVLCPAEPARCGATRLSREPASLEGGAAALVRTLWPAGTAFRSVSLVRAVARGAADGAIGRLADGGRAARRACAEVRWPGAHRGRSGAGDGLAATSH